MTRFVLICFFCWCAKPDYAQSILKNIDTLSGYENYEKNFKVYEDSLLYYKTQVSGNYIPADRKILIENYNRSAKIIKERLTTFVTQNKDNQWGAIALLSTIYHDTETNIKRIEELAVCISQNNAPNLYTDKLEKIVAARKNLENGIMTDVQTMDKNHRFLQLSSQLSDYILLNFWASWCGPCRAKNALLSKQYALYKNRGIEIFNISLDQNKNAWRQASRLDALAGIDTNDAAGFNSDAAIYYRVTNLPKTFLIDVKAGGTIQELHQLPLFEN